LQLLGAARRQLAAQERFDFPGPRIEQFRQDLGIVTLPRQSGLQPVNILGKDIVDHIRRHWFLAEPLYQRALAIREKALGPEHPNVATCLENYASLLRKMGRPEEAATLEVRARAIRAKNA
jgi:Tetratricopeptide repeat